MNSLIFPSQFVTPAHGVPQNTGNFRWSSFSLPLWLPSVCNAISLITSLLCLASCYCVLSNHIHLFLYERKDNVETLEVSSCCSTAQGVDGSGHRAWALRAYDKVRTSQERFFLQNLNMVALKQCGKKKKIYMTGICRSLSMPCSLLMVCGRAKRTQHLESEELSSDPSPKSMRTFFSHPFYNLTCFLNSVSSSVK